MGFICVCCCALRFYVFGVSTIVVAGWTVVDLGAPERDAEGKIIEDEFSILPLPKQYLKRMWRSITYYQKIIQEPSRDKLLPDPLKPPYYQPKYTLVLEMKDVLVHPDWTYKTGWRFKKRPGVDQFLEQLAGDYEIVVYTADQGMTVFPILDALDPKGYIMYRLVRDATHFVDGHHVKNLDNLNRDLKKVIVIDWDPNSTKLHPENTFHLERWTGNDDDLSLLELVSFLKSKRINNCFFKQRLIYSFFSQPWQVLMSTMFVTFCSTTDNLRNHWTNSRKINDFCCSNCKRNSWKNRMHHHRQ